MRTTALFCALALAAVLAGCGDKVPESQAAKRLGDQPKQTVNKATEDVTKALQQGAAERSRQAD